MLFQTSRPKYPHHGEQIQIPWQWYRTDVADLLSLMDICTQNSNFRGNLQIRSEVF